MSTVHDGPGSPEQLGRMDLNLLVTFDALCRERNVTRAAQRLGITQSAASHALRRLRDLLDDPLLVRAHDGMLLTPRAEALIVPVRSALVSLGRALADRAEFTPAQATRAFSMATPDLFDILTVPLLLGRMRDRAPGVSLAILPVMNTPSLAERLATGDVDLAIVPRVDASRTAPPPPLAQGLVQKTLFRDRFACFARADHPALAARDGLTLAQYCALPHALVAPGGSGLGPVDEALAERGRSRQITLRIPHFFAALAIVARSDLLLTAPASLAALASTALNVRVLAPPLALPEHAIQLMWHERFSHEPGHTWLRALVSEVAREALRGLVAPGSTRRKPLKG